MGTLQKEAHVETMQGQARKPAASFTQWASNLAPPPRVGQSKQDWSGHQDCSGAGSDPSIISALTRVPLPHLHPLLNPSVTPSHLVLPFSLIFYQVGSSLSKGRGMLGRQTRLLAANRGRATEPQQVVYTAGESCVHSQTKSSAGPQKCSAVQW